MESKAKEGFLTYFIIEKSNYKLWAHKSIENDNYDKNNNNNNNNNNKRYKSGEFSDSFNSMIAII